MRPPGSSSVRVEYPLSASATVKQTVPDRLVRGSPAGTGDPGDSDRGVGTETAQRAGGHRLGDRLRHRAVRVDQRRVHAEQLRFGFIGVGHQAADKVGGRTGPLGEARCQQSPSARLRGGDPAASQQLRHLIVHLGAVVGEDLLAVPAAEEFAQLAVGVGGVGLVARDHFDLSPPQTRGDLQGGEIGYFVLRLAKGLGQTGFRQPEHSDGVLAVDRAAGDGFLDGGYLHGGLPHWLQFARRPR